MIGAAWQKATTLIAHFRSSNIKIFTMLCWLPSVVELKEFEIDIQRGVNAGVPGYFEGCLPVEILARRDPEALTFGPMRPIGLTHHQTVAGRPYAIVQLRQDNVAGTLYNLVGFQTNLKQSEQARVFRMIPGLENAEFVRYGQMHRNTFIFSPAVLSPTLQFRKQENIFFAGQITGVEGYMGNIATGLLAGINAAHLLIGRAAAPIAGDDHVRRVMPIYLFGKRARFPAHESEFWSAAGQR